MTLFRVEHCKAVRSMWFAFHLLKSISFFFSLKCCCKPNINCIRVIWEQKNELHYPLPLPGKSEFFAQENEWNEFGKESVKRKTLSKFCAQCTKMIEKFFSSIVTKPFFFFFFNFRVITWEESRKINFSL